MKLVPMFEGQRIQCSFCFKMRSVVYALPIPLTYLCQECENEEYDFWNKVREEQMQIAYEKGWPDNMDL